MLKKIDKKIQKKYEKLSAKMNFENLKIDIKKYRK